MQLTRCPNCHSRINLEALVQDESGRQLLALLTRLEARAGSALVVYIGLFRSKSRDLANDRALRLAEEALELAPIGNLVPALVQVVEQMRQKQQAGAFKPLTNHNYLQRVLESTGASFQEAAEVEQLPEGLKPNNNQARRAAVTGAIMDIRDTDW